MQWKNAIIYVDVKDIHCKVYKILYMYFNNPARMSSIIHRWCSNCHTWDRFSCYLLALIIKIQLGFSYDLQCHHWALTFKKGAMKIMLGLAKSPSSSTLKWHSRFLDSSFLPQYCASIRNNVSQQWSLGGPTDSDMVGLEQLILSLKAFDSNFRSLFLHETAVLRGFDFSSNPTGLAKTAPRPRYAIIKFLLLLAFWPSFLTIQASTFPCEGYQTQLQLTKHAKNMIRNKCFYRTADLLLRCKHSNAISRWPTVLRKTNAKQKWMTENINIHVWQNKKIYQCGEMHVDRPQAKYCHPFCFS